MSLSPEGDSESPRSRQPLDHADLNAVIMVLLYAVMVGGLSRPTGLGSFQAHGGTTKKSPVSQAKCSPLMTRIPFSPKYVIDGAIRLPMHLGMHAWPEEFEPTGHGRQYRLVAVVAVVVPGPRRGKHQIARAHKALIPLNSRIGPLALDDKTNGRGRMPVRWRGFTG